MKRLLVTAALPYANAPLHFGHLAGVYLPADIYVRFERLRKKELLFVSGSDEYGVAITLSAELQKRSPQEQVDHYHKEHKKLFEAMHIAFDIFSRTTNPWHAELTQAFFCDLLANGHISLQESEQLYSETENRFLADRYVVGRCPRCQYDEARGDECGKCAASYEATDLIEPRSKLSGQKLIKKKSAHYFLHFEHFKEKLTSFLEARPLGANVEQFVKSFVQELRPRAITRDLEWGVKVPLKQAQGKVFYVWFDAPIGYISATVEWAHVVGEPEKWRRYWLESEVKNIQFMGKDNIPFHALFFPAMIMGQNTPYKLVDEIVASEFYNLEGRKFSKSEGWYIDVEDVLRRYSVDQLRYMLAATAPESGDSDFSWKEFQSRCNGELVGKLGNFVHRVLVFTENHCEGVIPSCHELQQVDNRFVNAIYQLMEQIEKSYETFRVRRALQQIVELMQLGNGYFDVKAPWRDAKLPERRQVMETTLNLCIDLIRLLALSLYPIIPDSASKMWQLIGQSGALKDQSWHEVLKRDLKCVKLPKPSPLFFKIEDDMIEAEINKLHQTKENQLGEDQTGQPPGQLQTGQPQASSPLLAPLKPLCTLEEFGKLDLRVGKVLQAEKIAKSRKLLKLAVDIGLETRTIVSGISEHYNVESIVGKKIVVIANLQSATIMGVESRGMVLAATLEGKLELLGLENLAPGAQIS